MLWLQAWNCKWLIYQKDVSIMPSELINQSNIAQLCSAPTNHSIKLIKSSEFQQTNYEMLRRKFRVSNFYLCPLETQFLRLYPTDFQNSKTCGFLCFVAFCCSNFSFLPRLVLIHWASKVDLYFWKQLRQIPKLAISSRSL